MSDYPPFKMPLDEAMLTQRSIRRVTQEAVAEQNYCLYKRIRKSEVNRTGEVVSLDRYGNRPWAED